MKIGIVSQSYYPVRGGVTEHVYHLGRELSRRGHEVTVIAGHRRGADDRGLNVVRLGRMVPLTLNGATVSAVVGWRLGTRVREIQSREKFDVLHIHQPSELMLAMAASEAAHPPLVGTFHTAADRNPLPMWLGARYRRLIERFDARIAVSPSAAEFVTRYVPAQFEIIPNGVDTGRFSPTVEGFPAFRDDVFTILFVGRMDPRKGARFLFMALPYLERELKEYRVLVVGDGWRRNVYRQFIPLGLERRVVFAGAASVEDMPRYFRSADVFCSPATGGESFGIVLLEAMASGLPVVASRIPGYQHVMEDEVQGRFAAVRNPADIAAQIVSLARDSERRKIFGQAGRQRAIEHDWQSITDRVLDVYRRVIG